MTKAIALRATFGPKLKIYACGTQPTPYIAKMIGNITVTRNVENTIANRKAFVYICRIIHKKVQLGKSFIPFSVFSTYFLLFALSTVQ